MPTISCQQPDGTVSALEVPVGKRLMQAAVNAGVDGIVAECGGQAMCATCHVYVAEPWRHELPPISEEEDEMLEDTVCERTDDSRLSCQIVVTESLDGLRVRIPAAQV